MLQNIAPDDSLAAPPLLAVSGYSFTLLLCAHFMFFDVALFQGDILCDALDILHL